MEFDEWGLLEDLKKIRPSDADVKREAQSKQDRAKRPAKRPNGSTAKPATTPPVPPVNNGDHPAAPNRSEDATRVPEAAGLQQTHDSETPGVDEKASEAVPSETTLHHDKEIGIDWRKFKTLDHLFVHVGGYRPVQLDEPVKKITVSGAIDPLFAEIQAQLKTRFAGAVIHFPWGPFEITDKNKVFNTKSTLIRYLMFDALRDGEGSHVQYAKQWLALNFTSVFDPNFRPDTHIKGANEDALDIYAVLFIAHTVDVEDGRYDDRSQTVSDALDGYQIETLEQVQMMNTTLSGVVDQLKQQNDALRRQSERSQMMQTVLLLDRMGLLRGGVPRDVDGFAKLLEDSRDALNRAGTIVDKHIDGERSRAASFDSERRKQALQDKYK